MHAWIFALAAVAWAVGTNAGTLKNVTCTEDADEDVNGNLRKSGNVLYFGVESGKPQRGSHMLGFRFADLGLPPGAIINSARLRIMASGLEYDEGDNTCNIKIDAAMSGEQQGLITSLSSQPRTKNSISWDELCVTPWFFDTRYYTPDITAVVQEVADLPNSKGLLLMMKIYDDASLIRTLKSIRAGANVGPVLELEFSPSGSPTTPFPTSFPSKTPTRSPSRSPSPRPTTNPTRSPTTKEPTTATPTLSPTTKEPTTAYPTMPTHVPTLSPTTATPTSPTVLSPTIPGFGSGNSVGKGDIVFKSETTTVVRVLYGITVAVVVGCALMLVAFRSHIVMQSAQPVFLGVIILGACISSFAILLFAVESDWACMASVWCYGIGFALMYSALLVKMDKISRVFSMQYRLSPEDARQLAPTRLLRTVAAILAVEIFLFTVWQLTSPMTLNPARLPDGSVTGTCSSGADVPFLVILALYHLGILLYSLRVAIRSSRLHTAFSEGKYIRIAIFNGLQFSSISIIVLYFTNEAGTSMLMRAGAVALHDITLLVLLFGPKLQMILYGTESESSSIGGEVLRDIESRMAKSKPAKVGVATGTSKSLEPNSSTLVSSGSHDYSLSRPSDA